MRNDLARLAAVLALLVLPLGARAAEEAPIACTADPPAVPTGDAAVHLRAWLEPPGEAFAWTVDAGTVQGNGPEVVWDLAAATPGEHRAVLKVTRAGGPLECTLRVSVLPTGERAANAPGGAFLVTGREEKPGYGLYSYLLFGERPRDDDAKARYGAVIDEYLVAVGPIAGLEAAGIAAHQINVTYLPVTKSPAKADRSGAKLLDLYDYPRARRMLSSLPGEYRGEGPYIVSTLARLGTVQRIPEPYLYQDLSLVAPKEVKLWARAFLNQAAQERFWEERTLVQLGLRARTIVAVAAAGYPQVKSALDELISWKTKVTK